ncbi:conserved hypothetical protein [Sporisorium reilianum SRZ2]|uniref:Uncharacterized protein n=1 Tax=Sporisorium reilianum (strain SRZ2) TaxID=999809 RepID=E6ZYE5_SPORE|nr:conserved hypothetical protein [Sporisorium reilianum SRZ2]
MAPTRIPGSSEPYSLDEDADTSPPHESDDHGVLNAVPQHPHSKGKATSSPANAQPRHQLSSITHPTIASSTRQNSNSATATATTTSNGVPVDGLSKRKSIGSKVLSKFKRTSTADDKADPANGDRSQYTSGSHTPAHPSHLDDSDAELKAHQLKQALSKEQQRRANARLPSSSSADGLRNRGRFFRKYKQAHLDSDVEEEHDRETAHYISEEAADLNRFQSDVSRHFPGGLYDTENASMDAHLRRNHSTRRATTAPQHGGDYLAADGHGLDDGMDDGERRAYDSDDSDDTIAHLIREADGYDSLRYNVNGNLSAGIDFDTLQAVREKERSMSDNKDAQSSISAYSGGASKALSQPLLELEDIELETFLQNFARHTREVTVTRPAGMQKYRMPKWSDFRVSPDDNDATSPGNKRPSMLTRVDRGLHHLSENLKPPSNSGHDRSRTDMLPASQSGLADDELDADSASDDNDANAKKKSRDKAPKKHAATHGKLSRGDDDSGDEDWDLIVPSSGGEGADRMDISNHDELRVNAQDEGVDGVAFCIAYILALVEQLAPEEIEHHPDRGYREGLIRSHVERLYTIAPFWEQLGYRIRRLYRWEDPKTTAAAAMIYFVLWYTNMIPTAFILMIMFCIMRFKYFPPSESYLHDKVKNRMARGQAANTLSEKLRRRSRLDILNIYKRWVVTFGAPTQEAMGLVADFHEKVKNLILWRNPAASRRTLILFGVLNLFVTFAPAQYVSKAIFFFVGITFFCLLPLQSYFPSHRKALSPLWWATFGAPTDAQFAVQLLRKRHLDVDRFAGQLTTAEDVRRAVRSQGNRSRRLKPRPDRREEGIAYDQIEDPSRASTDYVEMSNDATLKPRKLGSFFCQYKGLPGRLHINTRYLYFTPLHSPSQKRGRTPIGAIESIVKTKSIRLMVWSSLGLKIVRNNGQAPLLLANLPNRDEAFNLILAVSTNGE